MPDRYWEASPEEAPDLADQRSDQRKLIRKIAARRREARDRARKALARHSLIETAAASIPWEVVADREAATTAQASYTTMRATSQAVEALRRAGVTVESADDLTTLEAQAILSQINDPIIPENPEVLRNITDTITGKLRISFVDDPALRT